MSPGARAPEAGAQEARAPSTKLDRWKQRAEQLKEDRDKQSEEEANRQTKATVPSTGEDRWSRPIHVGHPGSHRKSEDITEYDEAERNYMM